jgi:hypothetical protein
LFNNRQSVIGKRFSDVKAWYNRGKAVVGENGGVDVASPFPGMDPYIEAPEIWSDFHSNLASEIQAQLNPIIQPKYVARLTPYVTYDIVEVAQTRGIRPDVAVWQSQRQIRESSPAYVAIPPAPAASLVTLELPLRLLSVEIHQTDTLELVTAIEILSPVNKRPGHDAHRDYLRKRQELLRSSAHLLEIDLLRGGSRPPLQKPVPEAPYYVTLSRADRRPHVAVWPIQLTDKLPLLPIPLLEPDPDAPLDLAKAVAAVYERGGYTSLIDYSQAPPPPPLSDEETVWLAELGIG